MSNTESTETPVKNTSRRKALIAIGVTVAALATAGAALPLVFAAPEALNSSTFCAWSVDPSGTPNDSAPSPASASSDDAPAGFVLAVYATPANETIDAELAPIDQRQSLSVESCGAVWAGFDGKASSVEFGPGEISVMQMSDGNLIVFPGTPSPAVVERLTLTPPSR